MSLPEKLTENWQETPSDLFETALDPKSFQSGGLLDDGTIIKLKVQIQDQLENEIFFPMVKLAKDDQSGEMIEQITIFRENLTIPGTIVDVFDYLFLFILFR